ncbi:uncharacterized protein LOC129805580 isoform X1 [Phlebotomus papatasi]|uniref:uncharacterized protein LOC129805580 isoform X1 n=1 Tax=Phlebotomus papatasi TaxID=29031 RepID=UPI00248382D7|nr:uncharacterized protein LOC129805580 isoform X1 [Phlebotomus papatasi]XP_055709570.1 uncharacterized protein LOC129805580 isoform X1 [Phlebotomus papatasi]
MDAPSMVQRSGDTLIVRSVVSGNQLFLDNGHINSNPPGEIPAPLSYTDDCLDEAIDEESIEEDGDEPPPDLGQGAKDEELPQCKIKRNYSCNSCTYFTQNPRLYLTHLRDKHGEKIVINECKHCLYASRHYQKLVRHMKMVHGSTEGLEEHHQSRKRAHQMIREIKKRRVTSEEVIPPTDSEELPPFGTNTNTHTVGELNKLLKCSVCDFTTLSRSQLTDHERNDHIKTKFFRCSKCSYVTHIKARFSKHVKYHSMPMIKCIMCDFRTPYKWNLDRHMKNHGGTGPFKCAACNFTADIKQSLTVHEMNHHVPPVGHASGMSMHRRKNKVGGTDVPDDPSDDLMYRENADSDMQNFDESLPLIANNNNRDVKPFNSDMVNDSGFLSSSVSDHTVSPPSGIKKVPRPIPNLIPIQNASTALNLSVGRKGDAPSQSISDLCANSSTSALKDFASLFAGGREIFSEAIKSEAPPQMSPSSTNSFKKKHASFFDKLREKCVTNSGVGTNMTCSCGHVSKCLSEALIHQDSCKKQLENSRKSTSPINLSMNVGSTRCQICRHRCKSSADLIAHMQTCIEQKSTGGDSMEDSVSEVDNSDKDGGHDEDMADDASSDNQKEPHPMENVVFVWNKMPEQPEQFLPTKQEPQTPSGASETEPVSRDDPNTYCGVETAPGYGEVTKKIQKVEEQPSNSCLKKVFKCPHCSFWASTASRFHVHIVGHLNKKPFECSLCSYRSNWRWDITKHIRLKTIRDPSHKTARVLMNDETGRRNYTKYNKYITLMKVTDEDGNLKLMKSGEMTPNQEAALQTPNLSATGKTTPDFAMLKKLNQNENLQVAPVLQDAPPFVTIAFKNLEKNNLLSVQDLPFMMTTAGVTGESIAESFGALAAKATNQESDSKKTLFKCKKCQFKHANRETVLAHVKRHYEEAGLLLDNSASCGDKKPLVGLPEDLKQVLTGQKCEALVAPQMPAAAMVLIPSNNNNNNNNENGELDEASSGGTTVMPGWRGATATYRCGHCHQVSNWKHVIQRHCRLKHNGDIQIELMEPNGKVALRKITSSTQVPAPVNATAPQNSPEKDKAHQGEMGSSMEESNALKCHICPFSVCSKEGNSREMFKVHMTKHSMEEPSTSKEKNEVTPVDVEASRDVKADPDGSPLQSPSQQMVKEPAVVPKSKRYNCTACPYVTDSKSQFVYHKSFHKPRGEQFKCTYCTYNVTKKHLLNQHVKLHRNEEVPLDSVKETSPPPKNENVEAPILPAPLPVAIEKAKITLPTSDAEILDDRRFLHFCDKCPARFLCEWEVKIHGKSHSAGMSHCCSICTFSSRQESLLQGHMIVHSGQYQEETKDLEKKYKISSENPKPVLVSAKHENATEMWTVSLPKVTSSLVNPVEDHEAQKEQKITRNCPNCPFVVVLTAGNEGNGEKQLEDHKQHHVGSSSGKYRVCCSFCDFATNTEKALKEHTKWHFAGSKKKNHNVEFFTKFDNISIFTETGEETTVNGGEKTEEDKCGTINGENPKMIFDEQKMSLDTSRSPLAEENKIYINLKTGEIIKKHASRF